MITSEFSNCLNDNLFFEGLPTLFFTKSFSSSFSQNHFNSGFTKTKFEGSMLGYVVKYLP